MINKILWDLINTGKVVSFIDDVIIGTEGEERHDEDGKWRLVVFLSKSLNEIEKNYKIHDKKMLAVIRELEN